VAILPGDFALEDMPAVFGFEFQPQYHVPPTDYFFLHSDVAQQPLRIEDYDYFFTINPWNMDNRVIDDIRLDFSMQNLTLTVLDGSAEPLLIDLAPLARDLFTRYAHNILQERDMSIPASNMTFTGESESLKYSLTFISISGNADSDGNPIFENIEFILLIGRKQ
jgi:hypothetical protein